MFMRRHDALINVDAMLFKVVWLLGPLYYLEPRLYKKPMLNSLKYELLMFINIKNTNNVCNFLAHISK